MKKVADHIEKWRKYFGNRCKAHEGGYEKRPLSGCRCEIASQVAVYTECFIPEDYQKYEISDFTGMKDGRRIIDSKIVAAAKSELVKYCWDDIDPDEVGNYDFITWWPKSAMARRRKYGNSIVIYGDPWVRQSNGAQVKTFKQPIGRTMLASIVMKEAIRMRMLPGHLADSYAWISYGRLSEKLMQQAKDGEPDDEMRLCESADWLCVDGFEIEKQNEATRIFRAKTLDMFFQERWGDGLPNILVFQDDISKLEDLRQDFGMTVNTIVNSPKTTRIKLLDGK